MNDNFENETLMAPKSITHRTINDPVLRKAIYKAFEGKCFYTGRLIPFKKIHIDHVSLVTRHRVPVLRCVLKLL